MSKKGNRKRLQIQRRGLTPANVLTIDQLRERLVVRNEARDKGTYWNGEPTPARRCRVIVGNARMPSYWFAGLEGTEREAVEVTYGQQVFYLDNEGDGLGWGKVTIGRGSPQYGHRYLDVDRVIEYLEDTPPDETHLR